MFLTLLHIVFKYACVSKCTENMMSQYSTNTHVPYFMSVNHSNMHGIFYIFSIIRSSFVTNRIKHCIKCIWGFSGVVGKTITSHLNGLQFKLQTI